MTNAWNDNPAGLYTNVLALKPVDIGTALNPLGTVYAQNLVGQNNVLANNDYLESLPSSGSTNLDLLKADATDNTVLNTPTGKVGKLAVAGTTVGTWDSNSIDFPTYNLTDGSDKNFSITSYGSGTGYTITTTPAAVVQGTSSVSLVLSKAGTYLLEAYFNVKYVAATFAAARDVTLQLNRTNNTPGVLTGSATVLTTDIITTLTYTFQVVKISVIVTTTNTNDIIVPFAGINTGPTAGSIQVIESNIVAHRLY